VKKIILIIISSSLISCNVFTTKTKIGDNFFPKEDNKEKETNNPLQEDNKNTEDPNMGESTYSNNTNDFPFELNFNDQIIKNSYSTFELKITNITENEAFLNINLDNLKSNIVEIYNPCNQVYLIPNESCFIELESYNIYSTESIMLLQYKDINDQIISKEFTILINN
jgi:uncharacterized protein YxeA